MASTIALMVLAITALTSCSRGAESEPAAVRSSSSSTVGEDHGEQDRSQTLAEDGSTVSTQPSEASPTTGSADGATDKDPGESQTETTFKKFPELGALTTAIPAPNEVQACAEVQRRLKSYRDVAVKADVADLVVLQDSLSEFEQNLYTAADEQDWGDRMIEQLTNVRRLWASSVGSQSDQKVAKREADSALQYLDKALAVDCPT